MIWLLTAKARIGDQWVSRQYEFSLEGPLPHDKDVLRQMRSDYEHLALRNLQRLAQSDLTYFEEFRLMWEAPPPVE